MENTTTLGIDLAKEVFQLHGTDENGKIVIKKQIKSRAAFSRFIAKLQPALIGMEACGSAHHWARLFESFGHQVKLMHPGYVKAYVQRNKHDAADAKACHEAVSRDAVKAIPIKTTEQQAILMLHKLRSRLIKNQTQLGNQIRGCLYEFGVTIRQGHSALLKRIPEILEDAENALPDLARSLVSGLLDEYRALKERIEQHNLRIETFSQTDEDCRRLRSLPGIGPITASAFVASLKGYHFKKGRQAAASLGLTPKEHSSGQTKRLGRISKQGNRYLRCLFVHGARSVAQNSKGKDDKISLWVQRLIAEKGWNKAVVALANKNARIAWSMLRDQAIYDVCHAEHYEYRPQS